MSALEELLDDSRRRVEAALDRWLPPATEAPVALHDAMRYAMLSGGKRLRPALAFASARACGADPDVALPVACAVELVHGYSLIHDDLPAMDDDVERRGMPTVHVKYGEAVAILAGDALLPLAFEVLARSDVDPKHAVELVGQLAVAAGSRQLVGGQADDLDAARARVSREAIVSIHRRKTGALFRFSVSAPALLAGAPPQQRDWLDRFAGHYGLAFQACDDLLDAERSETSLLQVGSKDEVRRHAERHLRAALALLHCFGAAGECLRALANQLLERIR